MIDDDPRWGDPRERDDDVREIEVHWIELGRGSASDRQDEDPRNRDEDIRERDRDPRDCDRRDVFLEGLERPRGLEREVVVDGDHRYGLNGDDSRSLAAVRAFRVSAERDLRDPRDESSDRREADLRHLRDEGLTLAEALAQGEPAAAWVFPSAAGTPMDHANVGRALRRALKAAGLPLHFSPHNLRHSVASLLLQEGESPVYVQRQLGHASIQLTVDTYGRWLPMGNKAAVDRLDEPAAEASGGKVVAEATTGLPDDLEVVEGLGDPPRTRTLNPEIKSLTGAAATLTT
jgi:hypothetical protein